MLCFAKIVGRQVNFITRVQGQKRPPRRTVSWDVRWRAALILIVGILAYSNGLSGAMIADDDATLVENKQIRELRLPGVLFPSRELPVAGRPLVNVSFAINYALDGLNVRGYHVGNVALHLLSALLLFGLVRRTLEFQPVQLARGGLPAASAYSRWGFNDWGPSSLNVALVVTLVWTVHPLNTEAVDYITQRTELMMGLFYLLTMYATVRAAQSEQATRWRVGAVIACALGMACKESMVTAPVVVMLFERIFVFESANEMFRKHWRYYVGLCGTWVLLAALNWSGPRIHSAGFSSGASPWTYLLNQTVMITRYLALAFWPRGLVVAYGAPSALGLSDVLPQALFVVLLLIMVAVALVRKSTAPLGFLGAWFFITLAPTSSIVPIATEMGAERRMYLPLAGLITLVVVLSAVLWGRLTRTEHDNRRMSPGWLGWAVIFMAVVVALSARTLARNRDYSSSLTMAYTVLEQWPGPMAHAMVGQELAKQYRHEEAMVELHKALPGYPKAHYHLGGELFNEGRLDESVTELQAFIDALPMLSEVPAARMMIGKAFMTQRKWPDAVQQFRSVLAMTPSNTDARGLLADSLLGGQQLAEAIREYRAYLSLRPDDLGALTNIAVALSAAGHGSDAIPFFKRAVALNPGDDKAHRNLAGALMDHAGDPVGAAQEAREAVRLKPTDPAGHDLLGRALAMQGNLAGARGEFERALQIDPGNDQARSDLALVMKALPR